MFEKNLNDLVRGIRNNRTNEGKYIAQCMDDIKQELRQENMAVKANAVAKLTYLQMLGYDISWAAFNVIEVMSSSKFTFKRTGYLSASQSFHEDLDVLMLTTNLIKKDMASQNQYDAGVSMNGLACFITPDLARDLANDIMNLMISSKPYIRKKSVLLMYKVFLNFPEALRPAFPRLKEKLEDTDTGVQCAAVNVICELARKNPHIYLSLAPLFFKLMTTSCNNWMLIKIIKLFGALCPLEPRLGKKLMEPLTSFIHSTSAMSLLYECINTVIAGLPGHLPSIQLCVSKLRLLIEDPDQNLKYLGLLALNKILQKQPKAVLPLKDMIIQCLDDRDESIRYRALDLVVGMVSKKTLVDIVKRLTAHIEKSEGSAYRDELVSKIIQICSQSNYQYITDFEWYIDTLIQLCCVEGTKHGKMIASQMLDVTIRVRAVREYAVKNLSLLLSRAQLFSGNAQKDGNCEILYAAAWLSGEFAQYLPDMHNTLMAMLNPRVTSLPGHIQSVYVQNIAKLYVKILVISVEKNDEDSIKGVGETLLEKLPVFAQSSDLEVQERACCILQLVKLILKMNDQGADFAKEVCGLFEEELLPVAGKAQKKVPIPDGLDLDAWINEPPSESSSENEEELPVFAEEKEKEEIKTTELDEQELQKRREARKQLQATNPHYLKMDAPKDDAVDDIPVKKLSLDVQLHVERSEDSKGQKRKKKRKGKKKGEKVEIDDNHEDVSYEVTPVIDVEVDGPSTTVSADDGHGDAGDPHRLLNIDLDKPLEAHEVLPVRTHRMPQASPVEDAADSEKPMEETKQKKSKHKKEKESKKKHKHEHGEEGKKRKKEGKEGTRTRTKSRSKSKTKVDGVDRGKESVTTKATLLAQASQVSKSAEMLVDQTESATNDNMTSIDFWLSTDVQSFPDDKEIAEKPSPIEKASLQETEAVAAPSEKETKTKSMKKKKSKEAEVTASDGKRKKKSKKKEEKVDSEVVEQTTGDEDAIMLADEISVDPHAHYRPLAEDVRLALTYDIKVDPLKSNQVYASIIFRNRSDFQITSMEFNIIDSLNMKLVRAIGAQLHDPVKVPFQLPPGMTNEGQFAFTVDSIVMAQWLRGTLTYIIKTPEGSTSEKIDFKINFPVHAYILPTPIKSDDFTTLLASGELTEKQSSKIPVPEEQAFTETVKIICSTAQLTVVELLDRSASLYGYTIQMHPICLLVKFQGDNMISIDAKSTNYQLLSALLSEIKEELKGHST